MRVYAPDVYADWLLWKIPELRGRSPTTSASRSTRSDWFKRLLRYNAEFGRDWKSFANGYRIVVVDENERSHTADFLAEPGTKKIFHDTDVTVLLRPTPT